MTWSLLVWFAMQRRMTNLVFDGLLAFVGVAYGLLSARGRRISRGGCSGGPVSQIWWISPVCEAGDDTSHVCAACFSFTNIHAASSWTNSKLRDLNTTKRKRSPKRSIVELFYVIVTFESKRLNTCVVVHFSTNQMQIKSNENVFGGVSCKTCAVIRWAHTYCYVEGACVPEPPVYFPYHVAYLV